MNLKRILTIALYAGLTACNNEQDNAAKTLDYIPGVYVRAFAGEYSSGYDTLVITAPDKNSNFYTIKHSSSFKRIIEKQVQPIEYKSENWTAVFDKEKSLLIEQKKGKQLLPLRKENKLLLGNSVFQKIK